MTSLPESRPPRRLGLVIDLDTCVGCQACVVHCKEWNTTGYPAPLTDQDPYGATARGAWLNRVHGYEVGQGAGQPDGAFSEVLPALRGCRLRHRVPDRGLLQARRGRHRPGRRGAVHRLRALRLGLPLRRARARRRRGRDEEMHALHRSHLQRELRGGRPGAGLRADLSRPAPATSAIWPTRTPPSRAWWPSAKATI